MPYSFLVRRFGQRYELELVRNTTDHITKEDCAEHPPVVKVEKCYLPVLAACVFPLALTSGV
jgi:hypothetical protein